MEQEELKITSYLRAFWRRKWLIVLTTLAALSAGIAVTILDSSDSDQEARFIAAATLRIEDQASTEASDAVSALQLLTGTGGDGTQSVQTHIEVLRSSAVMGRSVNRIRQETGLPVETDQNLLEAAAALLAQDVRVSQVSGSNLIIISASAVDPDLARLRTDSIVAAYQQFLRDQKLAATQDAIDAIDQRIAQSAQPALTSTRLKIVVEQLSTADLARVEQAIESSVSQINSLDLSQFAEPSSLQGLISELDAAKARLQTASIGLTSLEDDIAGTAGDSASVTGLQSVVTVQGLTASSLVTVRQIRDDFDGVSLSTDLNTGISDLASANITMSQGSNQLISISNSAGISTATSIQLAQLGDQVQALGASNTTVSNGLLAALNSGEADSSDRQRLVTQLNAVSSSLEITVASLAVIRQTESNSTALTQMVTVEGLLQTVADELIVSATNLTERIASGPDSDLDELEKLLSNAVERLDRIRERLGGAFIDEQLLQAEIQSAGSVLRTAAGLTATLRTNQRLRLVASSVDLISVEPELNTGANLLDAVSSNLSIGSPLTTEALLDRVGRARVTIAAALAEVVQLEQQIGDLDLSGPAEPVLAALTTASASLEDLSISVVSVSQVIDATVAAGVSQRLGSRLSRFSSDLAVASEIFTSSSERMGRTVTSIRSLPVVVIGSALLSLESAQVDLMGAATVVDNLQVKASSGELLTLSDGDDIGARLQLVQSTFADIIADISQISSAELDLTAQTIGSAESRIRTVLAQLSGIEAAETAAIDDLFQVRRELQLSVLGPQETGVALVDTDLNEIPPGDNSAIPVDARVLAGAVGGFLFGLIAAFMLELLDRTVRRPEEIGDIARVPSLGLVPAGLAKGNPHPPEVTDNPTSVFAEAVHLVTTQIQGRVNDRSRLLLISSPGPGDGKTMMAVNLARALSLRSLRVLLVDANFRKPDASKIFEFENEPGLATALTQSRDPGEFIKHIEDSSLDVLPAGRSLVPPVELISRPSTGTLLQNVRDQYDFVIIDGPPTLGFSESNALAKQAGAVIMVARSGKTKKADLREAMEDLADTEVLGVVMNFVSPRDLAFLEHRDYAEKSGRGKWRSRLLKPIPFSKN